MLVKNILVEAQLPVLQRCGAANTLLAFDFDGTLAPLDKDPRAAQLRAGTRRALAAVAERYPTVVISGRARADVLARLGGVATRAVIGNHGLEPSPDAQRYSAMLKTWLPTLRKELDERQGVEIENKLYSLSIHYREAKAKSAALAAIRGAVSALGSEATAIERKWVVDVLPAGAPHRGSALSALRRSLQAESALYVGEDAADDQAFTPRADEPDEPLLEVHVGRGGHSKANYYLAAQSDIDRLLKSLLDARPATERLRT
jgi:trehalose 6-phosphate phosphatase